MILKLGIALGGFIAVIGAVGLYIGLTAENAEWFAIPFGAGILFAGFILSRWSWKRLSQQPKNKAANGLEGWLSRNTWFGPSFLLSLIVVPVALLFLFEEQKPVPKMLTHPEALTMCQIAVKRTARDPETAKVPYVDNYGKGSEFYYAWGRETKFARMKNGLGLEVPVSASCTIDGVYKRITALTVDGKSIIGP